VQVENYLASLKHLISSGCKVQVGIVGKPNAGKSHVFSAATLTVVPIANYPFTTISQTRASHTPGEMCVKDLVQDQLVILGV